MNLGEGRQLEKINGQDGMRIGYVEIGTRDSRDCSGCLPLQAESLDPDSSLQPPYSHLQNGIPQMFFREPMASSTPE